MDSRKHEIAGEILLSGSFSISTQVINEVCNNMLKKLNFDEPSVMDFIDSCYKRYHIADITKETFLAASMVRTKYAYSYWDSMILASALVSGNNVLYSEDFQSGQKIGKELKIINPFG